MNTAQGPRCRPPACGLGAKDRAGWVSARQGVARWGAALAEVARRRRGADALPRLGVEVLGRDRTLHRRQGERLAVQAPAEHEELARLVIGVVWGDATAVRERPLDVLALDGECPVAPRARVPVLLGEGEAAAVEHKDPPTPVLRQEIRSGGALARRHLVDAVQPPGASAACPASCPTARQFGAGSALTPLPIAVMAARNFLVCGSRASVS